MSDQRFEYDEELLSLCAQSQLASLVGPTDSGIGDVTAAGILVDNSRLQDSDKACFSLHEQHALHYNKPLPSFDDHDDGNRMNYRLRQFLQTVLLIHEHNHNNIQGADNNHQHQLGLNQFADQIAPISDSFVTDGGESVWESLFHSDFDSWVAPEFIFPTDTSSLLANNNKIWNLDVAANLTVGHGGIAKHKHKHKHKHGKKNNMNTNNNGPYNTQPELRDSVADKVKFPDSRTDPHFSIPLIDDPAMDGELLKVIPRKHIESGAWQHDDEGDQFGVYLNWATQDNPDGVPIVQDPIDQGECGSCWALAATGSLEASVSRRQALDAYNEYLEKASLRRERLHKSLEEIQKEATEFARSVESAAFQMSNLSIQELIDCDTAADQGCIGGNPLLAFYFIHRFGLTTWDQYPYAGEEEKCSHKKVGRPIAQVKAWGIISPNHEAHMELVLRYIGPIAVGINGAERSFLSYQKGIYDKADCRQGANHALLIVGYGEEQSERTGNVVKYWIARNSWGKGWGEDGYIRIKRGSGLKGVPGVCGIARSPSVALGGVLLADRHRLDPYHDPAFPPPDSEPLSTSPLSTFCGRLGFQSCSGILDSLGNHRALVLGLTGVLCAIFLAAWPLTFQCRRRRARRRAHRAAPKREERLSVDDLPRIEQAAAEVDPLLGDRRVAHYGESNGEHT